MAATTTSDDVQRKSTDLELSIVCKGLRSADTFSKNEAYAVVMIHDGKNWVEVGQTEEIKGSDPVFVKKIIAPFFFEEFQKARIEIRDRDGKKGKYDLIGAYEINLKTLASKADVEAELSDGGKHKNCGKIFIHTEQVCKNHDVITAVISGKDLQGKDGLMAKFGRGTSDCYLKVFRLGEGGQRMLVHQTEVRKGTRNPTWKKMHLPVQRLSNGAKEDPIVIEAWDWDRLSDHDFMGRGTFTISDFKPGGKDHEFSMKLVDDSGKKRKDAGVLNWLYTMEKNFSFIEFLRRGTKVQITIFIDGTQSNGDDVNAPDSLHHIRRGTLNPYQQAMMALGTVIAQYDPVFNVFVFGVRIDGEKTHCHPLDIEKNRAEMNGVEDMMETYEKTFTSDRFNMSGPTVFSSCMKKARSIATRGDPSIKDTKEYHIALFLTDGVLSEDEMEATKKEIIDATKNDDPLSIVILGIGEGEQGDHVPEEKRGFAQMEELDSDTSPLMMRDGTKACRDIVQFVAMNEHPNPARVYRKVLEEVPSQLEARMRDCALAPGM